MPAKILIAFLLVIAGAVALVHASVVYAFQIEMANIVPMITATSALLGGITLILADSNPWPITLFRRCKLSPGRAQTVRPVGRMARPHPVRADKPRM